ncbi:MAG TPA: hypothetical protein VFU88_08070 [Ktedonobacterales bacterium]|nr:hypothetical protein [Ktedonobacterales bacterium]
MRRTAGTFVLAGMLAALVILAGCGVTGAGAGTGTSTSTTTPLASPTASPVPTGPTILQGLVTVTLGKTRYATGENITVYINNGQSQSIWVANHQTSCSLVTLELQSGSVWREIAPCQLKTPTGLIEIKPGTSNTQHVLAPGRPAAWPTGTYRVRLTYALQRLGPSTTTYSGTFTVA